MMISKAYKFRIYPNKT
ncbi:helix-turn-helix domain-containing protein, partial [Bacillus toyonensis]|nr:helix-turn-helix domain-containing protein [Bacillus toyonensis]MBF7150820.1 helix-turn-helix domain-containing protein [Bacillus toyonensis]